ncbi:phosphatase PAP2 family protein [Burkholderia cenocepacia]|uniref:phosphatase PAP2 family protein n=1 Tax=Burkholderia cenocepacia TaxID=95486 RepID=UPI00196B895A|nr:phosphatase PAP2 family protein [Burkholderia cenocepacia]MBN3532477.1 phosphatase PAP2 family protein [Burkholderia cenocepacia]MBO1859060.1 phosphatase PAP2 family protein [Burkholderia cenocepacia]MBR8027655.1 phosphatase PAP2 family protein [Burkholderia cenocepacia]MBR8170651.1 phosphatase PAP2 family protein [Burkholderia cenocepacia]MBR8428019.1 phosphatase PAP2 family protein [Burkholderia cenocepacia]
MNTLEAFNQALFLMINATPATPPWLIRLATVVADDLIYLIPMLLTSVWLSGSEMQRNLAVRACVVAMVALGANQLICLAWQHPRPFMIGLGHTFIAHAPDSSFPSDHATVFAGIALTLLAGGARMLGGLTLLAGVAVAWARIFLGVHFPLDMLGAAAVACATYVLIVPLWHRAGDAVTRVIVLTYRKLLARPIASGWLRR